MKFLLDTHVWLWAVDRPAKLGRKCRAVLENDSNELSIASISALELGQLEYHHRLKLRGTIGVG